jgi:hypothetical protein
VNDVYLAMHPTPERPFAATITRLSLLELGVIELLWRGEDRPEMAGMRTLALSMIERERTEREAGHPAEAVVVLRVCKGGIDLLRSVQGVSVKLVNYDDVEDWLDCAPADEPPLPVDADGARYVSSSPPVHCAECGDWIGDDEPRVSMGAGHDARSICLPCRGGDHPVCLLGCHDQEVAR